jgi:hypothetical protein
MAGKGRHKGKGIMGSQQYGLAGDKETPQIAIDLAFPDGSSMTTFLFFSAGSAQYSFQRLAALGWKGKGAQDLANLTGIDANEVDIEVKEETYDNKTRLKAEILVGPGRVIIEKTVDPASFAARVAALVGNAGGAEPAAGPVKPPF